jgi:hypothetical protein
MIDFKEKENDTSLPKLKQLKLRFDRDGTIATMLKVGNNLDALALLADDMGETLKEIVDVNRQRADPEERALLEAKSPEELGVSPEMAKTYSDRKILISMLSNQKHSLTSPGARTARESANEDGEDEYELATEAPTSSQPTFYPQKKKTKFFLPRGGGAPQKPPKKFQTTASGNRWSSKRRQAAAMAARRQSSGGAPPDLRELPESDATPKSTTNGRCRGPQCPRPAPPRRWSGGRFTPTPSGRWPRQH